MSKQEQGGSQEDKKSSNENNNNNQIKTVYKQFYDNSTYNPFLSQNSNQNENEKTSKEIKEPIKEKDKDNEKDNEKENEKDNENDVYSSPLTDIKNKEIIDINTPSKRSEYFNEDDAEYNSANERNKEKLKKGLMENNNNISSESPISKVDKIHSEEWGNNCNSNNDGNWGSSEDNDKKDNSKEKKNDNGSVDNNKNVQIKNENDNNEIRVDVGPLPLPKETEKMFDDIKENKKEENEMTWFNRDGRKELDEYADNYLKKLKEEQEKINKIKENKVSDLESIDFKMYYVKVYSNEEPKLLQDTKRPKIRFENLKKVPKQLMENVKFLNYDYLTPIQRVIMPYIQYGKDIVCIAETGSGKTLSYLFPIIGKMLIEKVPTNPYISNENDEKKNEEKNINNDINGKKEGDKNDENKNDENKNDENKNEVNRNNENKNDENENNENKNEENKNEENKDNEAKNKEKSFINKIAFPICLIIAHSRELVTQISKESIKLSMYTGIKTVSIIGGEKKSIQLAKLSKGCDILVSTPYRLIDFLRGGKINLQMVKYLILDEAEKLLEEDLYEQLKEIFDKLPKRKYRQNLLFSATFNEDVKGIAKYCLNNYYYFYPMIEIPKQIKHEFYHLTTLSQKIDNLLEYLKKDEIKDKSIIIYVNNKKYVDQINKILDEEHIRCCSIHGDKMQNDRNKAIREFSLGYKNILISTDITSRGLDFPNVYCVINFDIPRTIEDYIHRIGRTGRLGQEGLAITYIDRMDENYKENLIKLLNNINKEVPSWINEVEYKKSFGNYEDENDFNDFNKGQMSNRRWNNDNNNYRNRKRDNYNKNNKWNKRDNNEWREKSNNDKNDDWEKNDNEKKSDGWGDNNQSNDNFCRNNNDNNNKENDGWETSSNNRDFNNNKKTYKKNNNYNQTDKWKNKKKDNNNWGNNDNNKNNSNWGDNNNNNNTNWGDNNNNNNTNWGDNNKNNSNWESTSNKNNDDEKNNNWNNNYNDNKQSNDNVEILDDAYEELFVVGINYDSVEDDLKQTFEKYGEIISCKILRDKETQKSKGIGFVKFSDKKSAVIAMNDADNIMCQGRNLRMRYSNNKGGEFKGKGKKFEKRRDNNNNDTTSNWNNQNEKKNYFNNKDNNEFSKERGRERGGRGGRGGYRGDRGEDRGGRGGDRRGRGRGGGRGRGRGNNFNNNRESDNWDNKNKNEDNNNWNNDNNNNKDNDDGWGDNKKKEDKGDSWGDGNTNDNNWRNDENWGKNNNRERSRDKNDNDDNW